MLKLFASLLLLLLFYNACNQPANRLSPHGYDLTNPAILKMATGLNEVSGIAFHNGVPDTLFAVQDEEGRLFYYSLTNGSLSHQKFGKGGDYEDITIIRDTVIILRSDGTLYSFPLNFSGNEKEDFKMEKVLPPGEYEAIFGDQENNLLFVLCKNCRGDKSSENVSGFIMHKQGDKHFTVKENFQISSKAIAEKLKKKRIHFSPSALARNENNKEWYILSSVNRLLVITDEQWKIKEVFGLDPALFPQPEGIAFDKLYNLYISNERASFNAANVLKFTFKNIQK